NRLCSKDMLVKVEGGYTLTSMGDEVFHRLTHLFGRPSKSFQKELYSFVTKGSVQGPILTYDQLEQISNGLIGKWFDKYRFTTKISKENSFEFNWLSTNGSISVTLQVGPRNELTISTSASIYSVVQNESQLLINSISQMLESLIDAPIIFLSHQIFQNTHKISQEAEYAKFNFAG
ncbi:MAG: hypothetical protein OEY49_16160, partial [Candidatus Heimdallarchaeota archaeon]|nr:hypothetical protein [Candidatus Heimdallarchaeota archaeon]